MDQLSCMRMFVRVVEQGSFVRVAESFSVAPSTVTYAVAQLEREVGIRLLHRTTRRVSPTEEGQRYYEVCQRVLDELREVQEDLSQAKVSPHGRLRVSLAHGFAQRVLYPELPRFFARYPRLELDLVVTDRAVNLVEEGVDCAVRASPMEPEGNLVARPIAAVHWVTCASPSYLADRGLPASAEALRSHDCIGFVSPTTGRQADWVFARGGQVQKYAPAGRLSVSSLEAAANAAVAGLGIAQVPDPLVYELVRQGRLRPVLVDHVAPAWPVRVVYLRNRYQMSRLKAFADFIAEIHPPEGWWTGIVPAAQEP
jgi:LysR family transcriptional regulator for bpeEF and oprC